MDTIFVNLNDYTDEPLTEESVDFIFRTALSRCGYHVFRGVFKTNSNDPLQVQINELVQFLTWKININSRINIKTLPNKSAILTFLP